MGTLEKQGIPVCTKTAQHKELSTEIKGEFVWRTRVYYWLNLGKGFCQVAHFINKGTEV